MSELLTYMVGDAGPVRFGAAMLFALIGVLIRLTEKRSETCFLGFDSTWAEWRTVIQLNVRRALNTLLVLYVFLRFPLAFAGADMLEVVPEELVFLFSIIIGFSFDRLPGWFKAAISRFTKDKDGTDN